MCTRQDAGSAPRGDNNLGRAEGEKVPDTFDTFDLADAPSSISASQNMTQESNTLHKTGGRACVYSAWLLLVLQGLAIPGMVSVAWDYDGPRYSLYGLPAGIIVARVLGLLIGSNFLAIPALMLGLFSWRFRKNTGAKWAVVAALVLIVVTTVICLLWEATLSNV